MTVAIFTGNAVQDIRPGKEEEFFAGMSNSLKVDFADLNALAAVSLEFMDQFGGLLVQPSEDFSTERTEALKQGIVMAGEDPDTALKKAREAFAKMDQSEQANLAMIWM